MKPYDIAIEKNTNISNSRLINQTYCCCIIDSKTIAFPGYSYDIIICDVSNDQIKVRKKLVNHKNYINTIKLHNNEYMLSADDSGSLIIWKYESLLEEYDSIGWIHDFRTKVNEIYIIDDHYLLLLCYDQIIKYRWSRGTPHYLQKFKFKQGFVRSIIVTKRNSIIVNDSGYNRLTEYKCYKKKFRKLNEYKNVGRNTVAWLNIDDNIVLTHQNHRVVEYSLKSKKVLQKYPKLNKEIHVIARINSNYFVVGTKCGICSLWDSNKKKKISVLCENKEVIEGIVVSKIDEKYDHSIFMAVLFSKSKLNCITFLVKKVHKIRFKMSDILILYDIVIKTKIS